MDLSWLNGMAPFMIAASVSSDRKVNSVRLMEAAISAIIIAIISTGAAYTTTTFRWNGSAWSSGDANLTARIVFGMNNCGASIALGGGKDATTTYNTTEFYR